MDGCPSWRNKYIFYQVVVLLFIFINFGNSSKLFGLSQVNGTYSSGVLQIFSQTNTTLRLYGTELSSEGTRVALVKKKLPFGSDCDDDKVSNAFFLHNMSDSSALVTINHEISHETQYYFCLKINSSSSFIHQGSSSWLSIFIVPVPPTKPRSSLPLPLQIILICILLALSGLFSGLNLGLMSLDPMELQIIMKSGTKSEQKFASIIYPIRKKGNFLLCTLLLGNVLVNNTLTILLSELTDGLLAVIGSTAGIVIMGEIVPQAICSRYGLHVGAYTIWLTKIFMVLTFILSYPISKVLDLILGKEIGTIYNRKKLLEMLKITDPYNDLATDEVNIIQGALELRSKKVEDVMTPIDDCYMIELTSVLDFETMREIMSTGYTRIPVYEEERTNINSILFVKDLAFVDPDDCMPLKTVCKFYQHPLNFVFSDITLDKLLDEFKTGTFHMAIVHKVNNEGLGDPFYEVMGIVTLEDVIEEIIKSEIVDETDVYTDNRKKKLNMARQKIPIDLSLFTEQPEGGRKPVVTPQILLAVHRFLLAEVEPFRNLSEKVLLKLLKQDVVMILNFNNSDPKSEKHFIYRKNKTSDHFVLILEGQVRVVVGKENLEFQGGPFSFYGVHALTASSAQSSHPMPVKNSQSRTNSLNRGSVSQVPPPDYESVSTISTNGVSHTDVPHFQPDYDLVATTDVKYIKITRGRYITAVRATKMSEAGNLPECELESIRDTPVTKKSSKKSLSSSTDANSNKNNRYDGVASREHYDISQSHPDLAPPHRQRAPHLRFQNKSMSSGQLMAIAAKYASVAGDRVHPTAIMRSIANSEIGDVSSAESEVKVKTGKEPDLVDDPATYNDDSVIESIDNDGEGRTLIP